jgi:hypothetical protein
MQENYNTVILAGTQIENKNIIEDALQQYESKAGGVLKAIESGKQISTEQKLHLSEFLSLQLTRVPKFRDWVVEKYKQSFVSARLGWRPIALRVSGIKRSPRRRNSFAKARPM